MLHWTEEQQWDKAIRSGSQNYEQRTTSKHPLQRVYQLQPIKRRSIEVWNHSRSSSNLSLHTMSGSPEAYRPVRVTGYIISTQKGG